MISETGWFINTIVVDGKSGRMVYWNNLGNSWALSHAEGYTKVHSKSSPYPNPFYLPDNTQLFEV